MSSPSHIGRAVRRTIVLSAVATAASMSAVAQEQLKEGESAPAATPPEEIVVTGSRLVTPNLTSISPVTTVTAADIQNTGMTRVEDVLNELPMVFAGQNSTISNGSDGTATLDLRGLGPQRTLVLVNGRRLGPGLGDGRNYSDINQIPALLIDRIDVETGGASSVYGADAVAGVVNFVLNTHFEGLKVDANYSFNNHTNGDTQAQASVRAAGFPLPPSDVNTGFNKNFSVVFGSNFNDGKGNATFYATYDKNNATLESKYDYSACTLGTTLRCGGSPTSSKNGAGGLFLAYGNNGASLVPTANYYGATVQGNPGQLVPFCILTNPPSSGCTTEDRYNFGPINFLQRPNERWTAGAFSNYMVNDHLTVYGEAMFTRDHNSAQIAASGDFGQAAFIPCTNPLLSAQEEGILCSPANLAAQGNPTETVGGVTVPGLNMYVYRRNVEGGGRVADFTNDAMRIVLGVKGEIVDGITYDISAQHSTVDSQSPNENYFSNALLKNALNTVGVDSTGAVLSTWSPTATANCAVSSGDPKCVPYNVWNAGGVTGAATNYLSIPLLVDSTVLEEVVTGSMDADLGKMGFKLPTADDGILLALGMEYRAESAKFSPDLASEQGNAAGAGGATTPVAGGFHVNEGFLELGVPLIQHKPLAESLSLDTGYRYSAYSLGFNTNTYKLGLEWQPTQDVRFRASYQRAVRAPNIAELFSPQNVVLDGTFDPCSGPTPVASAAICAATGVSSNPAVNPHYGTIPGCPANQCQGLTGGSLTLAPEKADTYSAGIVLHPTAIPSLVASIDYFNIKINDVIAPIGGDTIAQYCESTGSPTYCGLFHRDALGSIGRTQFGYVIDVEQNLGALYTRGVDLKTDYTQQLGGLGKALFDFVGTKAFNLSTTPVAGQGSFDCIGRFAGECGQPTPGWRHAFTTTWETPWSGLDAGLRWRYFGAVASTTTATKIPHFNWFDLNASMQVIKGVRMQLGVNNILDKDPPVIGGKNCPAGSCNGNTFPSVYDWGGRYIYAHLTATF
jgi:outer membrane receptor protein involved in Fe transport